MSDGHNTASCQPYMVDSRSLWKQKRFYSVRYSWTNTLNDQIRNIDAWGDDILENDPSIEHHGPRDVELINNHRIVVEMTRKQVFLSWGEPLSRGRKENNGIQRECWIYSSQELYFDEKDWSISWIYNSAGSVSLYFNKLAVSNIVVRVVFSSIWHKFFYQGLKMKYLVTV